MSVSSLINGCSIITKAFYLTDTGYKNFKTFIWFSYLNIVHYYLFTKYKRSFTYVQNYGPISHLHFHQHLEQITRIYGPITVKINFCIVAISIYYILLLGFLTTIIISYYCFPSILLFLIHFWWPRTTETK